MKTTGTFSTHGATTEPITLDRLAAAMRQLEEIKAKFPPPPGDWNGTVKLDTTGTLPCRGVKPCDMCGGDGLTSDGLDRCYKCDGLCRVPGEMVNAVIVDRVFVVSREAWDALLRSGRLQVVPGGVPGFAKVSYRSGT